MISALDTHETVKSLTAVGFTDAQAEALTAAVKQAVDIDLSNIATKTDIADFDAKWRRRRPSSSNGSWGLGSPKWQLS
jgi:hypothetical protein